MRAFRQRSVVAWRAASERAQVGGERAAVAGRSRARQWWAVVARPRVERRQGRVRRVQLNRRSTADADTALPPPSATANCLAARCACACPVTDSPAPLAVPLPSSPSQLGSPPPPPLSGLSHPAASGGSVVASALLASVPSCADGRAWPRPAGVAGKVAAVDVSSWQGSCGRGNAASDTDAMSAAHVLPVLPPSPVAVSTA
eukprot:2480577-Pleurochrysis_carterae.AAC.2